MVLEPGIVTRNEDLFVNVEVFRSVADLVNGMGGHSKTAEEALFRLKDIAISKEKIYDKYQKDLEQVEQELIQLDKILFNA